MLSSVFCSSTSCGWISTLKRREVWNSRISTWPSEMSFSGRSKCGSHTARMAPSSASTRVSGGTQPLRRAVRPRACSRAEEGDEVLRQVFLVVLGQRADDAEVQRDVAAEGLRVQADLDVARVHVGVEEAVAEDLGEEDRDAVARQLGDVDAGLAQAFIWLIGTPCMRSITITWACTGPTPSRAPAPGQPGHVAAQLRGVGGLAHQVELVVQVDVELGHHLARRSRLPSADSRSTQRASVCSSAGRGRSPQHARGAAP
jgi:hypothetical protein